MRLGIFGGSFDPVHFGHLLLAESCREQCALDQVWFLPAAIPPHKQQRALTTSTQRLEMLQLAIAGHPAMKVCSLEIERGGVSYTSDTLEQIQSQQPEAQLFFLMGADSLRDLPHWHAPDRICQLAIPVVVQRGGTPPVDVSGVASIASPERIEQIRQHFVEMPTVDLSSTDIRHRVAQQRSIRYRTPRAVEQYILSQRLYQDSDSP